MNFKKWFSISAFLIFIGLVGSITFGFDGLFQ